MQKLKTWQRVGLWFVLAVAASVLLGVLLPPEAKVFAGAPTALFVGFAVQQGLHRFHATTQLPPEDPQ